MNDDDMKKLLESLQPPEPTLMELVIDVAIQCGRMILTGALLGWGLRISGFGG